MIIVDLLETGSTIKSTIYLILKFFQNYLLLLSQFQTFSHLIADS